MGLGVGVADGVGEGVTDGVGVGVGQIQSVSSGQSGLTQRSIPLTCMHVKSASQSRSDSQLSKQTDKPPKLNIAEHSVVC